MKRKVYGFIAVITMFTMMISISVWASMAHVSFESELINSIQDSGGAPRTIVLDQNITLTQPLIIPANFNITLASFDYGGVTLTAPGITVERYGMLNMQNIRVVSAQAHYTPQAPQAPPIIHHPEPPMHHPPSVPIYPPPFAPPVHHGPRVPGDVLGQVLSSDIRAYINGFPIPIYIADGVAMVVVEDLTNYGFTVAWNEASRILGVGLDRFSYWTPLQVGMAFMPGGTPLFNFYYTDIRTNLSGDNFNSFAIDGRILIDFDYLGRYGPILWDEFARTLHLDTGVTPRPLW